MVKVLEVGDSWRATATTSKRGSLRIISFVHEEEDKEEEEERHFLDECSLCKKHIGGNKDVFLYMGNIPFCSEECRREYMEIEEGRRRFLMRASSRRKEQQQNAKEAEVTVRPTDSAIVGA